MKQFLESIRNYALVSDDIGAKEIGFVVFMLCWSVSVWLFLVQ